MKTCSSKRLERRKATLGGEYVEKNLAAADEVTRPFQEAMTAWCWGWRWGLGWGDDVINAKTRSIMNLAMIGALGKMTEWKIHCRGARASGVAQEKPRAIIHVIAIYLACRRGLNAFAWPAGCWSSTGCDGRRAPLGGSAAPCRGRCAPKKGCHF